MRLLERSLRPRRFSALAVLVSASMIGAVLIAGAGSAQATGASNVLSIVMGDGSTNDATPGLASASPARSPYALAADSSGNIYVAAHYRVLKIDSAGNVSYVAGDGVQAPSNLTPGPALTTSLRNTTSLAAGLNGAMYMADGGKIYLIANGQITLVDPNVYTETLAVSPVDGTLIYPDLGTGGLCRRAAGATATCDLGVTSSFLNSIKGIAWSSTGTIYLSSASGMFPSGYTNGVYRYDIASPGVITAVATTGLTSPGSLGLAPDGSLYVADTGTSTVQQITDLSTTPSVSRVAGVSGASSTGAPYSTDPLLAHLGAAYGLAVASDGKVYFNDTNANYVLRVASGAPAAPLNLQAAPDDTNVELTWDPPADPGASTMDQYEFSKDNGASWDTFHGLNTNVTYIFLTNGTPYTFQVRAHNSYGYGPSATITATPDVAPTAPGGLMAASGDQTATLSFAASTSIGGSAVSGYEYQLSSGNSTGPWTTLTYSVGSNSQVTGTIGSLTNDQQYSVSVRGVNTGRTGAVAGPVTVIPAGPPVAGPVPPGAPSTPSAVAGIGSVTVSWSAGSPSTGTTGYTVSSSPAGATCSTSSPRATRCVVTGTPGAVYSFTVTAQSAAGDSAASGASAPVTIKALIIPEAPPLSAPPTLTTTIGTLTEVTPSQQLTVLGDGFAVNTEATVLAYSSPIVLGTGTTDSTGALSLDVVIPATLEKGSHNIVATGVAPDGTQRTIRMPVALVPPTAAPVATAPAKVKVTAGRRQLTVAFDPSKARSRVKIIGYQFSTSSGRHWKTLRTSGSGRLTVTVTGLANGKVYGVGVRAITTAGPGEASATVRGRPVAGPLT